MWKSSSWLLWWVAGLIVGTTLGLVIAFGFGVKLEDIGERVCIEAGLAVETPIGISLQEAYWCGTDLRMTNVPDARVVRPFSQQAEERIVDELN